MSRAQSHEGVLEVPVIDLAAFRAGDAEQRARVAAQVDAAASTVGFMQVVGHAVPDAVVEGLTRAIDDFFALAMPVKKEYAPPTPEINRGYTPPKAETLAASLGVASPADLFEAFNVGVEASGFPGLDLDPVAYAENVWPAETPEFRAAVDAWFAEAGRVAREITSVMAVALGLDPAFFASSVDHSIDVLRMNNYEAPEATALEEGQVGMGAHTDYGIVTVLWADAIKGLQILDQDGVWHDVLPAPGALLVNLGDLLARWTNDRWISTLHRVLPPTDDAGTLVRRRSVAYFHDGNADAVIETLPGCGTPLYPATTVAEHLAAKLAGSRAGVLNANAEREGARLLAATE